jgi:hypothetical protein
MAGIWARDLRPPRQGGKSLRSHSLAGSLGRDLAGDREWGGGLRLVLEARGLVPISTGGSGPIPHQTQGTASGCMSRLT